LLVQGSSPIGYERPSPENLPHSTLTDVRERAGLTVRQLAAQSLISVSTIYRIEAGTTTPRAHVAYAVSEALKCSPWEITEFRPIMAELPLTR
jgi:transcriptional regulator with XRE-family HTH domain